MSFINKLNWKHYESYFKDMGVKDAREANEALRLDKHRDLLRELVAKEKDRVWSYRDWETDRKSTRLNSSHSAKSRMPSSA